MYHHSTFETNTFPFFFFHQMKNRVFVFSMKYDNKQRVKSRAADSSNDIERSKIEQIARKSPNEEQREREGGSGLEILRKVREKAALAE